VFLMAPVEDIQVRRGVFAGNMGRSSGSSAKSGVFLEDIQVRCHPPLLILTLFLAQRDKLRDGGNSRWIPVAQMKRDQTTCAEWVAGDGLDDGCAWIFPPHGPWCGLGRRIPYEMRTVKGNLCGLKFKYSEEGDSSYDGRAFLSFFVAAFVKGRWDGEVTQIPATVIDKGVMKNVPYMSFRSGNYEMNVYGDPAHPAGVEIGVYRELLGNVEAQEHCRTFMAGVMGNDADRLIARGLNATVDSKEREGCTFEVTPATAEDAYGGWWISVYSKSTLEGSRASTQELAAITAPRKIASVKSISVTTQPLHTAKADTDTDTVAPRTADELTHSRDVGSKSSGSDGQVYVRGYTRKNGTYVQPYTQSAPHR
jgi:hypothetical protein